MHIIFLTHYFYPEGNAPASRTFDNCKRWVAKGHKVTVVTGVPNVPDGIIYEGYKNRFFQWEKMNGISVLRVWTYIAPNKGFFKRVLNYLSFMISSLLGIILIKKGDLVIATSPQFFCGVAGFIFSELKKLPFILEVRDIWPESIIATEALKSRRLIKILEHIELFLYRHSKKIVVVTESFKKIISNKGIQRDKIFIVKNGADLTLFCPQDRENEVRKKFNLHGKFVISYIGTIGMAHALNQVLYVARGLYDRKDIIFLLVGSGAERNILIREKENKQLDNIIFIEKQFRYLIPSFYAASDICLVTLKNTPLFKTVIPSKIFEIMAMAKPIILGVDGEAREIIEKSKSGLFVEPENHIELKKAILRLYNNPESAQKLGRNGRRFVEKYFDRDKLANDYLEILTQSLNS